MLPPDSVNTTDTLPTPTDPGPPLVAAGAMFAGERRAGVALRSSGPQRQRHTAPGIADGTAQ